jgi:hypothetical protein
MTEAYIRRARSANLEDKEVFHNLFREGVHQACFVVSSLWIYELAFLLETSRSSIYRWERGKSTPKLARRKSVIDYLYLYLQPHLTHSECRLLEPGDRLFHRRYRHSGMATLLSKPSSGNPYYQVESDRTGRLRDQTANSMTRHFSFVSPGNHPHICPYCRAPALIREQILYCSARCSKAVIERAALGQ